MRQEGKEKNEGKEELLVSSKLRRIRRRKWKRRKNRRGRRVKDKRRCW